MTDYYQILGVQKTATAEEIKKAYRALAFKYHPDRNQGNAQAEEMLKSINQAYDILGDENKRRQYDYGQETSSQFAYSAYQNYSNTQNSTSYNDDPFAQWFTQSQWHERYTPPRYHNKGISLLQNIGTALLGLFCIRYMAFFFFPIGVLFFFAMVIKGVCGMIFNIISIFFDN